MHTPSPSLIAKAATTLILSALVVQTGCWSDATSCGKDTDCFSGELCIQGSCSLGSSTQLDASADLNTPNPGDDMSDAGPDQPTTQQCPARAPTLCGQLCVNTDSDTEHCGRCDNPCEAAQVCTQGVCAAPQPSGCAQEGCPDGLTCNTSTGVCEGGQPPQCQATNQCSHNERCIEGQCVCRDTFNRCDGRCYAPDDADHCGDTCARCPDAANATRACVQGQCELSCSDGAKLCQDTCAACPQDSNATGLDCDANRCVIKSCKDGFKTCADGNGCCKDSSADCSFLVDSNPKGRVRGERQWRTSISTTVGKIVELDGTQNPVGQVVNSYKWRAITPPNVNLTINPNDTASQVNVTMPAVGDYLFELTTYDILGIASCETNSVKVEVR